MQEETQKTNTFWAFVVGAFIIGVVGGYFIGYSRGQGVIIAEDIAIQQALQDEIAEKTNPFNDGSNVINPLEDSYVNPFEETTTNPFR